MEPETTTTEAAEPQVETTVETAETGTETTAAAAPDPKLAKARKESAGYRTRLRETEAERDQLRDTVTSLRRSIVDQLAEAQQLKPDALWAAGTQLDDLLDETGGIDPEKVTEAVNAARTQLGISRFAGTADQGAHRPAEAAGAAPTWGDLFSNR